MAAVLKLAEKNGRRQYCYRFSRQGGQVFQYRVIYLSSVPIKVYIHRIYTYIKIRKKFII